MPNFDEKQNYIDEFPVVEQIDETGVLLSAENNHSSNLKSDRTHKHSELPYSSEVKRKLIHLFSLNIPIWYIFLSKTIALSVMLFIMVITVLLDITSKRVPLVSNIWDKIFGDILRIHEKDKLLLNGASWLTISACLIIFIFPKIIAVVALSILIVSDISSALIGIKFGKTPFFKKSLEGSTAFFVSASLVVLIYYFIFQAGTIFLLAGIIASFVSAFFEAASKNLKIDDNLLAPISFSIVLWLGEFIAVNFGQSFTHLL